MNFAAGRSFISAYREQCDVDVVAVADFLEARKVSAIAAVKNRAAIRSDDESAEIAVQVCKKPGTPVVTRRERNLQRTQLDRLPIIQLVHNTEAEIMHEVTNTHGDNNRLVGCDASQRAPVQMIEVRMRHQNKIDRRQMMNFEARLFQTLDDLEPFRPDRINEHVDFMRLD